ncbi:MAG: helicase [Acidobacteriia bacterium]|nr:helicase [Terriglobia bacterium]MYK11751.1 helicase [Terriglobia bacterium]
MLRDRTWQLKYTPEDGDLIRVFYVPALEDAKRYDRLTGYFSAGALALAARGIEGLVHNKGKMRLVVGCTLKEAEIDAIQRGEELRTQVERRLTALPLTPPNTDAANALELLAWMIGRSHLDVKVAVPCDEKRLPVNDPAIFHEKSGVIEDRIGNKLAWTGSLNETEAGWQSNWESINVFTSWGREPKRVSTEERNFERLWSDTSPRALVLDVPDAVKQDLLRFLPREGLPTRLKNEPKKPEPPSPPLTERQRLIWTFIKRAPSLPNGGSRTGEATAAVTPWPHQVRAFERLYQHWPPRLLIADEVGLGKTIQAGLLLRQAWLASLAKRILILAPKAVLKQWQIELREKFNLNWPIYDGRALRRYETHSVGGQAKHESPTRLWHEEPVVIASSQLMRRADRFTTLVEDAEPWDLIILDEAHHARRSAAGSSKQGGPNALLKLMRSLKSRTQGLVLLTATPMQVHPVEVWDLLDLLGLPPEWAAPAFLDFFELVNRPKPSGDALERMARMFQAVERDLGPASRESVQRLTGLSRLKAGRLLSALRDGASIPRRQLDPAGRSAAIAVMRAHSPIRWLISRHTRELLRRYAKQGVLATAIARRQVDDLFVEMSDAEFELYEAVDEYISNTYNRAASAERSAVGFVMTVYRRRLASSFAALRATLEKRRDARLHDAVMSAEDSEEDMADDEALDDVLDEEEVAAIASQALAFEELGEIERLLESIQSLPPDSKLDWLNKTLDELAIQGYGQVMVFTQYTATMDFLREALRSRSDLRLMCFSGRGGEIPSGGVQTAWLRIDREQVKRRFRDGQADVLLCTDAASEGLNFQFCGALVNYDMPWNPMRVEQRIGRIDRVGQHHESVRVVNLHYKNTVETDVYRALRNRIGLFEQVVGRLQPILARMPKAVADAVLAGRKSADARNVADRIQEQVAEEERGGFDIETALDSETAMPDRPPSPITMDDLDRVIREPDLMPPGVQVQPMGPREYSLLAPGMKEPIRITTDPEYYEENSESVELWSPGNPFFKGPEPTQGLDVPAGTTLKDLLET